jgi:uncharacterized membrane protein YjgN (DUF898 family)
MEVETAGGTAPAAAQPTDRAASGRPAGQGIMPLRFEGGAAEYFRIWIVNVCLTLLTLGIYSAWAKVRRNRYFYGCTRLDGSPFHYTANPVAILKGRLIVVPLFVAYVATGYLAPGYEVLFWVALLPLLPWLVVKARRFALSNSVYRNIRFGFDATYANAVPTFLVVPLLVAVTFGLAFPYFDYRRNRFLVERARFGTGRFAFAGRPGRFYLYYLAAAGAYVAGFIVMMTVIGGFVAFTVARPVDEGAAPPETSLLLMWLSGILLAVFILFVIALLKTLVTNYVFRHTTLEQLAFESRLNAVKLFWIYLSNTLAILISVGLLIPWAAVRSARYRIECVSVNAPNGLADFVAGEHGQVGAAGEEIADFLDLDIGL